MIYTIFIAILFAYCAIATSNFIGEGNRPELFELMDNEIGIFRITIPEEQYIQLKNETQVGMDVFNEVLNNNSLSSDDAGFTDVRKFTELLGSISHNDFKTKDATLSVELNGETQSFKKVTFSLGGSSSRTFGKQSYNIKIRGGKSLYGLTQFRIRSDAREATFLRSKLSCDIHNRLGLSSISAGYITLYINGDYMGFYVLMDAIKVSWIEYKYGEKDTTHLYQCKDASNFLTYESSATGCTNENEEVTDISEWEDLLRAIDNAESPEDLDEIFDVDQFLYEMAFEYLVGSWDHFLNFAHNFYLYKVPQGKWTFMIYDFDGEIGQDTSLGAPNFGFGDANHDYPTYSFKDWAKPRHILDALIFNNSTRFDNILKKTVTEVFNPTVLFPRIDELKEFIRPYVELDKTPDANGKYPGRINEKSNFDYSLEEWDANCEFTSVKSSQMLRGYGLKYWILAKYRYVCQAYNMECDPVYMDESYEYPINKEVEALNEFNFPFDISDLLGIPKENPLTTTSTIEYEMEEPTSNVEEGEEEITADITEDEVDSFDESSEEEETEIQTDFVTEIETAIEIETEVVTGYEDEIETESVTETGNDGNTYQCWVEVLGYPCCSPENTTVYYQDHDGDWGYDFEKQEWCGLTPYHEIQNDEVCWSEKLGYPCCVSCKVYETDADGSWGYENHHWCGIQSYCSI